MLSRDQTEEINLMYNIINNEIAILSGKQYNKMHQKPIHFSIQEYRLNLQLGLHFISLLYKVLRKCI